MSSIDEFMESSTQILEANIGKRSKRILDKVRSKKNLNDRSNIHDFEEFIDLIELNIRVILGKNNAKNICNTISSKAIELNFSKQAKDIHDSLKTEPSELSISEFLKKLNISDVSNFCTMDIKDKQTSFKLPVTNEIDGFLMKYTIPIEGVIDIYAINIALKFCEDVEKVKKEIIEKIKISVRNKLIINAIRTEIKNFLITYPQPTLTDIDDLVEHNHLLNLNIKEDELRQLILYEMLYGKFNESASIEKSSELVQFLDIVNTYDDKKDITKEMQRQGIYYLIEDESGDSDRSLDEIIELITPVINIDVIYGR